MAVAVFHFASLFSGTAVATLRSVFGRLKLTFLKQATRAHGTGKAGAAKPLGAGIGLKRAQETAWQKKGYYEGQYKLVFKADESNVARRAITARERTLGRCTS